MINHINYHKTYTDHIQKIINKDPFLIPYFVTVSFVDIKTDVLQSTQITPSKIAFVWNQYDRFYRHLVSKLMNNHVKKPHLHPRTFDFIDFPGTRHAATGNLHEPKTPHVHSIYLLHPDTHNAFKNLVSSKFAEILIHRSRRCVVSVHAEPITHDLSRVVSYSSKFLSDYRADYLNADLFNQYPSTNAPDKIHSNPIDHYRVNVHQKLSEHAERTNYPTNKKREPPHESFIRQRTLPAETPLRFD